MLTRSAPTDNTFPNSNSAFYDVEMNNALEVADKISKISNPEQRKRYATIYGISKYSPSIYHTELVWNVCAIHKDNLAITLSILGNTNHKDVYYYAALQPSREILELLTQKDLKETLQNLPLK